MLAHQPNKQSKQNINLQKNTPLALIEKKAYTHIPVLSGKFAINAMLKANKKHKTLSEEYVFGSFNINTLSKKSPTLINYFSFNPQTPKIYNYDTAVIIVKWIMNPETILQFLCQRGRCWLELNHNDRNIFYEKIPPSLLKVKNWNSFMLSSAWHNDQEGYIILSQERKAIITWHGKTLKGNLSTPKVFYGLERTKMHQWTGKVAPELQVLFDGIHIGNHDNLSTDLIE